MEFAQSAALALQCIADAGDRPLILILSDINMPGMSRLELLPKAKALRPDVPIIMITAYGDAETKRKVLESGAEALLTKPIDFGMLRSEIDSRVEPILPQCASSAPGRNFRKGHRRNDKPVGRPAFASRITQSLVGKTPQAGPPYRHHLRQICSVRFATAAIEVWEDEEWRPASARTCRSLRRALR